MITPSRMVEIMISRSLHVYPYGNGWTCRPPEGKGPLVRPPRPTPIEAVEAAEEIFLASDQRKEKQRSDRVLEILQTGDFYVIPREIPNPEGGKQKVFDVLKRDGSATGITGRGSYKQAVIEYEEKVKVGVGAGGTGAGGGPPTQSQGSSR